jgi:thiol-disulfide isomerase/thioredoxin
MSPLARLALVAAAAALPASAGCDEQKSTSGAGGGDPPSRVNASKTTAANKGASTEAFCDVYFPPGKGPALTWPALAGGAAAPAAAPGWRWLNVWATWCKPCVEEMPRLRAWQGKLAAAAGKPVDLAFVSVDETDAEVADFRKAHPDAPPSLRLAEPSKMHAWFRDLGLIGEPPIPIHVFADATNHIRCARAAAVREKDYAAVEKLFAQ